MQYKLLVLDVDGVLVTSKDAQVSPVVVDAVAKIKDRVTVTLCTGRTKADVQRVLDSLGLADSYHVIESGAKVLAPDGSYAYEKLLLNKDIRAIYTASQGAVAGFAVCTKGQWLDFHEGELYPDVTTVSLHSHSQDQTKKILETIKPLQATYHIAVGSHWQIPEGNFILITNKDASKKFGIEYIQQKLGITKEETVAIGDMPNDLPLFEASGLKIAMGNAHEELKKQADFITKSIDEDGVASAIQMYWKR